MVQTTIDWERCFEDLEIKLPKVREELRARIGPLLKTDLRERLNDIEIERYPPRISFNFEHGDNPVKAQDWDRNREKIAIAIGEVASRHGLNSSVGYYRSPIIPGGKKRWAYHPHYFVLKPNYGDYEARETTPV